MAAFWQDWPRVPGTSAVSAPKMLQEAWAPQAEEMPKGQVKSTPIPEPSRVPFPGVMSRRESLPQFASTPEVGIEGLWNCISSCSLALFTKSEVALEILHLIWSFQ